MSLAIVILSDSSSGSSYNNNMLYYKSMKADLCDTTRRIMGRFYLMLLNYNLLLKVQA